ncbi:hypothetical protein CDD83_10893 [Cordyceps sp. RAO-2017]|nr:hypothetical protein CDD83_10893 [Cordyceps sp. RAO-2017]
MGLSEHQADACSVRRPVELSDSPTLTPGRFPGPTAANRNGTRYGSGDAHGRGRTAVARQRRRELPLRFLQETRRSTK